MTLDNEHPRQKILEPDEQKLFDYISSLTAIKCPELNSSEVNISLIRFLVNFHAAVCDLEEHIGKW